MTKITTKTASELAVLYALTDIEESIEDIQDMSIPAEFNDDIWRAIGEVAKSISILNHKIQIYIDENYKME